jgi:tetratricopeptide (TPR) repeat protein
LIDSGNFAQAESVLASILDDARGALDPISRARIYWSQSRLYSSKGEPDLAAHYARLTVGTLNDTEHTAFAAQALLLLAHIENDRGNAVEAIVLIGEGQSAFGTAGRASDQAMFLVERARALAQLGSTDEAAAVALSIPAIVARSRPTTAARAYATTAGVFHDLGDNAKALELYELAAELLPSGGRHAAEIYRATSLILEEEGRRDEAFEALKRSVEASSAASSRISERAG